MWDSANLTKKAVPFSERKRLWGEKRRHPGFTGVILPLADGHGQLVDDLPQSLRGGDGGPDLRHDQTGGVVGEHAGGEQFQPGRKPKADAAPAEAKPVRKPRAKKADTGEAKPKRKPAAKKTEAESK